MRVMSPIAATKNHALAPPVMETGRLNSFSSWLLSLGLVFSVATQLRLPGSSLGLGEILLLLWLLTTLVSATNWRSPALVGVLILTLIGVSLLGVGHFLTAYPAGQLRPAAQHDALAYAFSAVLAINYVRLADKYENSLPVTLMWAFLLSVFLAVVLGIVGREWSGVDVMYYHTRWQHLANNPNQFALLALPLPYLSLHLILQQSEKQKMVMPTLVGLLTLVLGWYSKSDALSLAWVGGGLVATLGLWGGRPKQLVPSQFPALPYAKIIAAFMLFLMVAGSAWQFRDSVIQLTIGTGERTGVGIGAHGCSDVGDSPKAPTNADQTQAGTRLCLWRNAVMAIRYAPFTGFGPGPHSGIGSPFEGNEAHNSLLDWGTQTGLIGAVALVGYLTWLLWLVARSRYYELVAMVLALYCFAMFHLMLRQPIFWIMPLLVLELSLRSGVRYLDVNPKK